MLRMDKVDDIMDSFNDDNDFKRFVIDELLKLREKSPGSSHQLEQVQEQEQPQRQIPVIVTPEDDEQEVPHSFSGLQLSIDSRVEEEEDGGREGQERGNDKQGGQRKRDKSKMTLLDLGISFKKLLATYDIDDIDKPRLTKDLLNMVDLWQSSNTTQNKFILDTSSESSMEEPDLILVDQGVQTDVVEEPVKVVEIIKELNPLKDLLSPNKAEDDKKKAEETIINAQEEEKKKDLLNKLYFGKEKHRDLEKHLSASAAVEVRRTFLSKKEKVNFGNLPFKDYNYEQVKNACCENVIGYMQIPMGIAGPLKVNGVNYHIPMATCEGALVASTNRGCKLLEGGVTAVIEKDGMTRAPVIDFKNVVDAHKFCEWLKKPEIEVMIRKVFEGSSRYITLNEVETNCQGTRVIIRFCAQTGDAMGMNMISNAVEAAMKAIDNNLHKFKYISISSNYCADKKAASINWIKGRGKSVIAGAEISANNVKKLLKTTVDELVELGHAKLLVGSSAGVAIGGSNAHAANIVAAIFLATGQDAAQVVSSSMCMTQLTKTDKGDLYVSCTMKCVEVGTVGGGTFLEAQNSALRMLGVAGSNVEKPGENARTFATIIASAVMAGELSLLASQCAKDLVKTHLKMNRSTASLFPSAASLPKVDEKDEITQTPQGKLDRAVKHVLPAAGVNCSSTF